MEEDRKGHPSSEFGRTSEVVKVKDSIQGNNGTSECEIFLASPSVSKAVFGTVSENDVNTSRGEEENQTKMVENAPFYDCKPSITSELEEKHVQIADDSKTACEDIMHNKTDPLDMLEVSRGESRADEGLEVAAEGQETAEISKHDKPNGISLESKVKKNLTELLHVTGDETKNSSLEEIRDTESVHRLVSAASSEDGRNGLKEKGNMDDNKEENMPVVDWNDKTDNDIPCNTNNDDNDNLAVEGKPEESEADEKLEEQAVEETLEEPINETNSDRPAAKEIFEEPAVQEQPKEPLVEKFVKEPAVEEKLEKRPDEEKLEEPTAEEKLETPATEEKCEEPEPSIHKLVSANSSEDILGALKGKEKTDSTEEEVTLLEKKGKDNTDSTEEEVTLLEKKGKDNTDSTEEEVTLLEKIDREIPYNTNTGIAENPTTEEKTERSAIEEKQSAVEEKLEEPTAIEKEQAIEEKQEKAAVDQKYEEPAIEELQEESEVEENLEGPLIEEPAVEEKLEKSAAEEKLEEPASQEKHEAPAIEEKTEELAVAEKLEEPATSVHTVVSTTSSKNILGGLKGKGNTDGIQERSMPTVVLPNKTENEIPCNANTNVAENLTVKEKLEEPSVEEKSEELTVEKPCAEGHSEERAIDERTASVSELVSTTSSEDILVDLKEKGYRDEIKESLLEKNTPVVDSNDKIDSEIPCNTNNDVAEKSKNEEKNKESAIANFEESAVEESKVENLEKRAIEETLDEQASKERSKEPAVEEVLEEPAVVEISEGPAVEAKFEEPKAEEKSEGPAVEDILGDMNEKDNVGDIKEEMTLLEMNVPTVDLFNKTDSEITCNANNHEVPAVEEKLEELFERTTAEEQFEEPTVAEKLEDPAVEENPEESAVEEKIEEPAGEEKLEEPANSARKLVSATVSEETLDSLKGKSNTDDTKEEETLLEKNMPVVGSNDKIGNEINTINDTANNPAIEEKREEPAEPTVEETLLEPKVENQFEEPEVEENPEEPEVEENPEEPTVEEKLEEQAIEEKAEGPGVEENLEKTAIDEKIEEPATSVDKLVSTMSSEDILGGMRENDSMDDIMEEITPTVKSSHKTDCEFPCNTNNKDVENPTDEEKQEELALEEPIVEEKTKGPTAEEQSEEPAVADNFEKPAVEENLENPTIKNQEPGVEENFEEHAHTTHKLVSATSSEDTLDGLKGKNNTDDIKEENMPVVDSNDEIGSEINTNNDAANNPAIEGKNEELAVEEKGEETAVEEKLIEPKIENKLEEPPVEKNPENPEVEELTVQGKHEEPAVEEKLEEPGTSADKLISATGCEDILGDMRGNDNMYNITEEIIPIVDLSNKTDSENLCNTNNNIAEDPIVEEKLEESVAEKKTEGSAAKEQFEEPTVQEKFDPALEENLEEAGVKEQDPGVEEKLEEPAASTHKLVSVTGSEEMLDSINEKGNMDGIKEEVTLLEKNMPVVDSNDKIGSEINTDNDVPNNPAIEEKTEKLAVEKSEETAEPSVENFIEPKVENKFEEPPVGKTHEEPKIEEPAVEEPATEEELEGPTVEEKPEKTAVEEKIEESATTVDKLVSTKSFEGILGGMKGNSNMDDINKEVMPTVELSNKTDREIQCNPNNNVVEIPTVEEKQEKLALEEPVVEEKRKGLAAEEPAVEEKLEEPEVEERPEGSAAEEHSEEPAAAEKIEESAFQDKFEKPEDAKKIEEPVAEENFEEPANSAHKLVSITGSEEMLDGLKGNSNTGETKEELTLLEKNMPFVDLNDKIGSEINTKDDTANNPAIEEPPEELAIQEKSEELTIEAILIEPNVENKFEEPPVEKNPEELTVDEKHEEAEVEEKLEEPATSANKLVSAASSEDMLGGMKGNDNMGNITVEVTLLKKIMPTVDLSNETGNENPVAEEKLEQPLAEKKSEAPATIEESEEPAVEQKFEPAVGEKSEEPAVEENLEEPAVKEQELGVEEKNEEPAVKEKHGEPAPPTNKLVSFTSSEEMLDGFKGESNMDDIKEELTLLKKNMSFVNSNDESGSEINTNNDVTNSSTDEENPEQPAVEEKSEPPAKREVEEKLKEPNLENKSEDPPIEENSEEPEVEEKPEEIAVKEKLEEPAVEEKLEGRSAEETPEVSALEEKIEAAETPIVKLVSVTSSEDILGSMKENDRMDDIMEENMQAVDSSNKIDSEISCNTDNNISENPTVKEKQEPAVEEKLEEPVVEEKTEGPATEEQSKEPAAVEIFEPAAEEKSEEPAIKEQEPGVEEKVEPAVKEELEEPAKSAHKLVTVTSSEEILDGFDGKSNMEEVILLEKNTLVVDSSDEIDSKINTNNDAANNLTIEEKPEEPNVEALIVEQKPEEPAVEEKLEEPSVGKPKGLAVEEKPKEQAVEEKNEEPAAPVIKLVSIVSSEHIIAGMKENDSMDDIMEENMPTIDLSNKTKSEISCNMNNNVAENSTLEEKLDEPALEEPIVEEKPDEPATEEQSEEPIVAENFESAVKEKSEEPAVEETLEEPAFKEREPGVEESFEEPAVEEKLEEPATSAHKLDSMTGSDKMLDGFKGKSNMEEVTLLEKNMPVVDSSDEIGSEVNTNNDPANNSTVEEKSEEPPVEEKLEEPPEPAVEEKFLEPKVENKPEELEVKELTVEEKSKEPTEGNPEEPTVEKTEEPAAEGKTEEPIEQEVKENLEEPSVEELVAEEKLEKQTIDEKELAVEEKFEGPAASVHKLVSTTISEDIHDGLEGKGKMDDIKEKTILVENNTPVVDSNDKTGGEIPSIDEKTEKQNREATDEGSEIVAEATRTAEIPKDNKAHGIFSENKVEKNLTELLPVTSDEYESSSFGELTKSTIVHKLDSATPSEAIPDSWNGNGDNGGIKEEVTITSIVQKNKDNSIIPEGEADDLNRQDVHTTQASGRTTPEVNTDQSRGKENELNEHLVAPERIDELETHVVENEVETEDFQQASLNTEEAKDTHGTENLLALSSEEMRVEDSTEKAQDGDKKLLSANKKDFTEPIQETRDLNSEHEASLTEKIVEEDMKKDNSLEATEVDSLNIEKDLDQTSDKGIAEHLEISSEGKKEEQRALEYVELKPSKDLTVDRIADPPASVENILEVVTAEASEDTIQNSNMDEEDLINNEHGQGKTLAVVAKEGLTDGKISDPPSTEIEKSLDSKTEVPQDKEILIIEDSNLKKECSQVYKTESLLKEREIIMIEENLEATGAETKSFQAITKMSEQIDTEEISYSSSEKKLKQEEEDLNLEMDGVNTTGITDSKEVESSDIGLQNHNKDIKAADNLELQSREIDIGHIIDTPVEKETNRRNNEKISEATEEELIHHTTDICVEINDKSAEEDVSCVDRLEEEDTLSSNQEKLNQEKNPEAKTDGNITTTKEIESSEIVSSSHEEEREKPRAEMDNTEEQLIHQRAEICYSDPETYSLQNSVDPDKSCCAPIQSSTGEELDIDEEQEKNSITEIDNKLDTEFDRKKDAKMQGFSVPKDDEITYASGTDTADNKQEQVEASLSGIEKVEAGPEESVKECISNEIVEEKKIEDGTREAALNATPEATVREESSTMEQFEEIKENSKKEETATYPELNPVVQSTECIETDERLDNLPLPLDFKDSDIVMAQMENLTPEEAHITTEAIREQEKGAIATGDIEIPEVPMAATGRNEIDETKAEDFSKDMEVSEGLVYQGRNFPDDCKEIIENSESSRLAKITPAFKNHEKDSAEKVAPKDQEDSDASDTVSCQKLKEEAAEQLFAPEKSEEQEEDLRETSGKDSSDNKQVHQELQATSSEPERGRLEPFGSEQKNKQVECYSKEGPEESRSRESQAEEFEDEEEQTDKEKGNDKGGKGTQETREESSSESPVIVEVSRDADIKVSPKKHQNILSGVGSKVKHSIAKVKKAITGKSSQTKQPSPK